MHLGYHELRNLLGQFRAEREARKNAPPPIPSGVSSTALPPPGAASGPRMGDRDHRRDSGRDRGYNERDRCVLHFIRQEYI